MMYTAMLISMFVSFVTSNDVLKYEPRQHGENNQTAKPSFCHKLDCPAFTVISKSKGFELRKYETSSWVTTTQKGMSYSEASVTMFHRLFDYIQGANAAKEKIAMTCPVKVRIIPGQGPACESDFIMSFFIAPSVGQAPEPSDAAVYVEEVPGPHVYVRQFGGFAMTYDTWKKEALDLGKDLDAAGKKYEKEYYYTAGYDAPFTLFNRHNEVWFLQTE